jgi:glycosyltransferase involved in cell wall biosynthesis
MNVTVALDARYTVTPDGSVWSQAGMARPFWKRYLEVFDTVTVVTRATRVEQTPEGWLPVNDKDIRFHCLPDFHGPLECLIRYPALRAAVRSATPVRGAVILRVGSQTANMMEHALYERNHPYGLEVVGDPWDVFAPGVVDHPLRPFFRWHFTRQLRRQCLRASGVSYVTKRALQDRYPTHSPSVEISDVELPSEAIVESVVSLHCPSLELEAEHLVTGPRPINTAGPYHLVTVGSLAQLYKGTDVLIDAVARCVRDGMDVTATIVGDGRYRSALMAQAERAGMASRIQFPGQITNGEPIRRILDAADLFVLPSRTEGKPRALIEAMARALPCIGSAVGGVPELLEESDLVPPGDPLALAVRIQEVLRSPRRMVAMSARNLAAVKEFSQAILSERRRRFYLHLRDCTESWERGREA